jgi:hypothetical protein
MLPLEHFVVMPIVAVRGRVRERLRSEAVAALALAGVIEASPRRSSAP